MRILHLTFTHVGHPPHRERTTSMESHKGPALASRLTIRFLVVTEKRTKSNLPKTRFLSTLDVIAGTHSPTFGPSDISQRRLHQQGKCRGYTYAPGAAMWFNRFLRLGCGVASLRPSSSSRVTTSFSGSTLCSAELPVLLLICICFKSSSQRPDRRYVYVNRSPAR